MRDMFVVVVLIATLVSQGTAQLPFGPEFHLSQYQATEGETEVVRLSAPILTRPQIPPFTGSIEVDITADDLSSDDPRQSALFEDLPWRSAEFGSDYLVNLQNPSSRNFTVTFQSKQANSSENVIVVANDSIVEGTETFRLRLVAARFFGQAAAFFKASAGLTNTVADVTIEDDDFVEVSWIISEPIEVREGEGVRLEVFAHAFGLYASPIEIGVVCAEIIGNVPPAYPDRDYIVLSETLEFTDVETLRSNSNNSLTLLIIDDKIAEPCENFICTLQGGAVDQVRGVEPNRVTVRICDDDAPIFHWAKEVYEFAESEVATVELVTDSNIEDYSWIYIQGFPKQITNGHPNHFPSLVVPGPDIPEVTSDAKIERATLSTCTAIVFGNAQVTRPGRTDVVNTIQDFGFTSGSKSVFKNFTIVDDDVLEFDEIFIAEFSFSPEILYSWNVRLDEASTAFILIRDDDFVEVNFDQDSYTVAESNGHVSVSLRIDGKFFYPVWAIIEVSSGTATDPEDFSSANRYNVTFLQSVFTDGGDPAPSTLSSPIIISLMNDDICEDVEFFQARIVVTSDRLRVRIGPQDAIKVFITDEDIAMVNFNQGSYTVAENDGQVSVSLRIDGRFFNPVWTIIEISNGTATDPGDFSSANRYNVTFPFTDGGDRACTALSSPIIIGLVDDDIFEDVEFFEAHITMISDKLEVGIGPQDAISVFITDDDFAIVKFNQDRYTVAENDGQVSVSLCIDGKFFNLVWAIIEVSNGTATDPGDFSSANRYNVTFLQSAFTDGGDPAPSTLSSPIIIGLVNDDIFEDVEFFRARIVVTSDRLRVRIGPQDAIKVFITDDDYPLCTFQHCTKNRAALCTVVGADGNCTNQLTSCKACYFAREERPLPNKCSTNHRNYICAGLTGSDLKECLQTWGKCVNKAFKDVHGKTPRRLRKKRFFKCPAIYE